ncbi:hypothetical protein LXL04_020558 [Taraxacum kok-saghyz]
MDDKESTFEELIDVHLAYLQGSSTFVIGTIKATNDESGDVSQNVESEVFWCSNPKPEGQNNVISACPSSTPTSYIMHNSCKAPAPKFKTNNTNPVANELKRKLTDFYDVDPAESESATKTTATPLSQSKATAPIKRQYKNNRKEVDGRRDRGSQHDAVERMSISFYITNLPKDIKTNELWNRCAAFGTVVDVYIAQKLSKMGRRFGFVRFIKVHNSKDLESPLCDMWFGNYHVFASIARFPKKDNVIIKHDPPHKPIAKETQGGNKVNRSYAKVVNGEKIVNSAPEKVIRSVMIGGRELTGLTEVQSITLAEVREPTSIPNLVNLCKEEGFDNIKIRYVGGLWVWVACDSQKGCKQFMNNVGIQSIFSNIKPLQKDFVIQDRLIWLEISALPMCVWNPCVFKKVASLWGVILFSDDEEGNCMSIGKVCIQTSQMDSVQELVHVNIDNKIYRVQAKEIALWEPEVGAEGSFYENKSDASDFMEDREEEEEDDNATDFEDQDQKEVEEGEFCVNANDTTTGDQRSSNHVPDMNSEKVKDVDPSHVDGQQLHSQTAPEQVREDNGKSCSSMSRPPGFSASARSGSKDAGEAILGTNDNQDRRTSSSMICLSLNICGIKTRKKRGWVKEICMQNKVNFVGLQETRMAVLDLFQIRSFWGNSNFDYAYSNATGRSGGIISVWDPLIFEKKHQLWNFVRSVVSNFDGSCIIFGDFNSVRVEEERFGTAFSSREAELFNNFIFDTGVEDVPMVGKSFTRVDRAGAKMSRLDRFLASDGVIEQFPDLLCMALDCRWSDHCSLLLKENTVDYGPIPFKIFNYWMDMDGFSYLVEQSCSSFVPLMNVPSCINFKNKLKRLKDQIKIWHKDMQNNKTETRKGLVSRLQQIDGLVDSGDASENLLNERLDNLKQLEDIDKAANLDYMQKSKLKWAVEGDENSKFFHGVLNRRRKQMAVHGVMNVISLASRSQRFKQLLPHQVSDLEEMASEEEVKRAVWDCGSDKAPGPDGFSFAFIKRFWSLFRDDLVACVNEFFRSEKIPKGCNSAFITFIPKVLNPMFMKDYRPISLIGIHYKIIAKLLANRLAKVIGSVISVEQSAVGSQNEMTVRNYDQKHESNINVQVISSKSIVYYMI